MDDDEHAYRRAYIEQAREQLAAEREDVNMAYEPPLEDPVAKWRREAEETAARRARAQAETAEQANQRRTADWERWLRGHLEAERKLILEIAGHGVGKIRAELCDEIHAALEKLRTRITALETQQRGNPPNLGRSSTSRPASGTRPPESLPATRPCPAASVSSRRPRP
jgi:hypothetical protein